MKQRGARGEGQGARGEIRHSSLVTRHFTLGFTLFEMLIVLVLFAGILGALLISFLIGRTSFMTAEAYIHVQQEARRAVNAMVRELREAGGSVTETNGPPDQLQFQLALGYNRTDLPGCAAQVDAICWGAVDPVTNAMRGDRCVRYRVVGTQLLREVTDGVSGVSCGVTVQGTARVLANNLNSASVTFDYSAAARTVTARLRVQDTSPQLPGGQQTGLLETRVRLRNN